MNRKSDQCWEFMGCKVYEDCPAYPKWGKLCFSTEGTLCRGEVQGKYVEKIAECRKCDFYQKIVGK